MWACCQWRRAGIDISRVDGRRGRADGVVAGGKPGKIRRPCTRRRGRRSTAGAKRWRSLSYPGESSRFLAEWWKQLYGESEGKQGLGIFPASCELTADLHSLGQYIQDGERILQETMLRFAHSARRVAVPREAADEDGLNYLAGRDYDEIFACAAEGIRRAHVTGGVPCMELVAERPDEETFGALVYFFEAACGISGYMQGVNPFDQPGVEEYKKNMFALLGKR